MKKSTLIRLFIAVLLLGATPMVSASNLSKADKSIAANQKSTSSLEILFKNAISQYPGDINLFDNPTLKQRMIRLLGKQRYEIFIKYFEVQTPVEYFRGAYSTFACQAHNCGFTEFEVLYFPYEDNLCIRYRVEDVESIFMEKETYVTWPNKNT
ncbi:MAG: hypothetical protein E7079_03370 [Bacteroidales bacterium]|nr:hypothetical protein [Bacteroidales bacterium]